MLIVELRFPATLQIPRQQSCCCCFRMSMQLAQHIHAVHTDKSPGTGTMRTLCMAFQAHWHRQQHVAAVFVQPCLSGACSRQRSGLPRCQHRAVAAGARQPGAVSTRHAPPLSNSRASSCWCCSAAAVRSLSALEDVIIVVRGRANEHRVRRDVGQGRRERRVTPRCGSAARVGLRIFGDVVARAAAPGRQEHRV